MKYSINILNKIPSMNIIILKKKSHKCISIKINLSVPIQITYIIYGV